MKCQNDGIYENKDEEENPLLISQTTAKGSRVAQSPELSWGPKKLCPGQVSIRELPPAGPGIKGKETKLPVPVMFPGQSLHWHSN